MRAKYWLSPMLIVALLLPALSGCRSSSKSAIALVPATANLVASVRVDKMVNDPVFRGAYEGASKGDQPVTADAALGKLAEETGIDLRKVSQGLVFGDVGNLKGSGFFGIIAEGTFDKTVIVNNLNTKANQKLSTGDYKGHQVYTNKDSTLAIVFLTDGMLVLGSPNGVKAAIDVSKGDAAKLGGQLLDTYNRSGDALVKAAVAVPQSFSDVGKGPLAGSPFNSRAFTDVDFAGFGIGKDGQLVTVRIDAHFTSASSATDAKDALAGVISLLKGLSQTAEVKDLLGKVEVSASGQLMTVSLKAPAAEIEKLRQTFSK